MAQRRTTRQNAGGRMLGIMQEVQAAAREADRAAHAAARAAMPAARAAEVREADRAAHAAAYEAMPAARAADVREANRAAHATARAAAPPRSGPTAAQLPEKFAEGPTNVCSSCSRTSYPSRASGTHIHQVSQQQHAYGSLPTDQPQPADLWRPPRCPSERRPRWPSPTSSLDDPAAT
jgi:hypothetical protein